MTKELLFTLSTGDLVRNTKTKQESMVVVIVQNGQHLKDISELEPLEDWELVKSRLTVTKEELARIAEYHQKIKEQMDGYKR